jgi:hypothetical protein
MSKLTLSVDPHVAEQAKEYAREHGTSVSRLVETYLSALPRSAKSDAPILREAQRLLKNVRVRGDYREAYRQHLDEKYQ